MASRIAALLRRPLRRFSGDSVTLHLEADSLRLVAARDGRVLLAASEPLPPEAAPGGVIADPQAVAGALRRLLAETGAGKCGLVVGLTGERSVPRLLQLPAMDPSLLREAVPREMKGELPAPLDQVYLSWQVVGRDNGQISVFALGVPRDALDQHLRAVELAGAGVRSIDVKPLALIRAVGRAEAIIGDLEPHGLDVIVVRSGLPVAIRNLGLPPDGATEDKVSRLGEELTRAVKFHNDSHPSTPLDPATPAFLTGSLATEAARARIVEASIGHPRAPLTPRLEWFSDRPVEPYMVNLGLALKER